MASSNVVTKAWEWITNLHPISQSMNEPVSLCIWTSQATQASLYLSTKVSSRRSNQYANFTISACTVSSSTILLWKSKSLQIDSKGHDSFSEDNMLQLFFDIITWIIGYASDKKSYSLTPTPSVKTDEEFPSIFNIAFLTLTLLVCIYEAPQSFRMECIDSLKLHLIKLGSREATKLLLKVLGSNLEEQIVKSVNLAITNLAVELHESEQSFRSPLPLFSHAISASRLWKVELYCPIAAICAEDPSSRTHDERLFFSLNHQQVEGVIQFAYKVIFRENWIDLMVKVDNIRCNVSSLVSEKVMAKRGYGTDEKFFPSRILLQLTPLSQTDIISLSVGKSSDNPINEIGIERGIETSLDPRNLKLSAQETVTTSLRPWKFEQSVHANSLVFNWCLHDDINGREVFSSKPSICAMLRKSSWFRNRYSSAHRPFTRQGGVIFAADEYGENVWWKLNTEAKGKIMNWEIKGWIWLTYWPNQKLTFHSETRVLEFTELVHIPVAEFE